MSRWVYGFGGGAAAGTAAMSDLLGGKGAGLAEMSRLGLPVPPGFTISTEVSAYYFSHGKNWPPDLRKRVEYALALTGARVGARFGDADRPLLVSVRSGTRVPMPGMMEAVLNLGLNAGTVEGLACATGDPRFAYDCYCRFIRNYSEAVLGLEPGLFDDALDRLRQKKGAAADPKYVVELLKEMVRKKFGRPFPEDTGEQLWGAIGAAFESWRSTRARSWRGLNNIPEDWGAAVTVQAMAFGNRGETSGAGTAFTRDPATGERILHGEFLLNAQSGDTGFHVAQPIAEITQEQRGGQSSMEEAMPAVFAELNGIGARLEAHFCEMQEIEFTVEQGKLFILETRAGKRSAEAALRIAVEMVREGLIEKSTAIARVDPIALGQLLHPMLDPNSPRQEIAAGLGASPGAASGEVAFTAEEAERLAADRRDVILVRSETSPEDIRGMHAARGVLTARGGMTSHAAMVARGLGWPCVCGAGMLKIDARAGTMIAGDITIGRGEIITIDGSSGRVFKGRVGLIQPEPTGDFGILMGWADSIRTLNVRANADTPAEAASARRFGAEGIGLCRTEHMFFDGARIVAMRRMILADNANARKAALADLLPMQRGDFAAIFKVMTGLPITIRMLDPPLHEFLPRGETEIAEVARAAGGDPARVAARVRTLRESNPMLGHRGCRLGIAYPEIYEMQARAIFEAALAVEKAGGAPVALEIMIPLVGFKAELDFIARRIEAVADAVRAEQGRAPAYLIGTMIELPRAALRAGEIAATAQFFSFGTNDLTQTTLGISRDDAGGFIAGYLYKGVIVCDPFVSIDVDGVGELVRVATKRGRAARPDLRLGICGEHGGDPDSIRFCHNSGLDYVSCSPFRVPIARLAAAQAALSNCGQNK